MNAAELAFKIDRSYGGTGEYVSAAYLGIIEAAQRWREDGGASLETFCTHRGIGKVREERRPRRVRARMVRLTDSLAAPAPFARPSVIITGTERQRAIANLIGRGLTSRQIAAALGISKRTVESERLEIKGCTAD